MPTESVRLERKSLEYLLVFLEDRESFSRFLLFFTSPIKTFTEKVAGMLVFLYNRKDIYLNERGELDV